MVGVLTFPGGFMLFTHAFSCFTLLGSVNMNTVLPGCAKAEFFSCRHREVQSQTEPLFPSILLCAGCLEIYNGLFSPGKATKPRHLQIVKIRMCRTQSKANISARGIQK